MKDLESYIKGSPPFHYLILGCGGGGDIAGCLPLAKWLKAANSRITLASLTWERSEVIGGYGPRPFSSIEGLVSFENIEQMQALFPHIQYKTFKQEDVKGIDSIKVGDEDTFISTESVNVKFQATRVSKVLQQPVIYFDINYGVKRIVEDLNRVLDILDIDAVICLDVGGDVLSRGVEPGLSSPLADAISLAFCSQTNVPSVLAIYAPNCDGELTLNELSSYFQEFEQNGVLIGKHSHSEDEMHFLAHVLKEGEVITEASRQPLIYLQGKHGITQIRGGLREVDLNSVILATYFFKLPDIIPFCPLAQDFMANTSLLEANRHLLQKYGLISEYEYEKRQFEQGLQKNEII